MIGDIYLIHFDEGIPNRPGAQAQHYLGWTGDLESRLLAHANGSGSKLMAEIERRGIGWACVRTWRGDRHMERKLKSQKNARRLCPTCRGES